MKAYNKLVRDKIPEIIQAAGKTCTTRVLNDEEYIMELMKKMYEESKEFSKAKSKDEIIEELADIQEVIDCIKEHLNISNVIINAIQEKKNQERGSFKDKVYLESVGK